MFGQPSRGLTILNRVSAEIAHRARGHADVLAELRLDQNDDGPGQRHAGFGFVGARTGHSLHFLNQRLKDLDQVPKNLIQRLTGSRHWIARRAEFLKQNNRVKHYLILSHNLKCTFARRWPIGQAFGRS